MPAGEVTNPACSSLPLLPSKEGRADIQQMITTYIVSTADAEERLNASTIIEAVQNSSLYKEGAVIVGCIRLERQTSDPARLGITRHPAKEATYPPMQVEEVAPPKEQAFTLGSLLDVNSLNELYEAHHCERCGVSVDGPTHLKARGSYTRLCDVCFRQEGK